MKINENGGCPYFLNSIEDGDFLYDFKAYLRYVAENKIKLTPKWQMIPRKDIYAINSLFRHPHQMEEKLRSRIYRVREEFELRYLHFIDLLSIASSCVRITHRDYLKKGENFTKFFDAGGLSKIKNLFLAWYFLMPWWDWFMSGGTFAERLQGKVKKIAWRLNEVKDKERIDFKEFANNLITNINVKWICIAGDEDLSSARSGIEYLLIKPMQYFEAVETYTQKGEYGIDELVAFKFTQPLGKYLINLLSDKTFDPRIN